MKFAVAMWDSKWEGTERRGSGDWLTFQLSWRMVSSRFRELGGVRWRVTEQEAQCPLASLQPSGGRDRKPWLSPRVPEPWVHCTFEKLITSWAWWQILLIPALGVRGKQSSVDSQPAWSTWWVPEHPGLLEKPCFEKQNKELREVTQLLRAHTATENPSSIPSTHMVVQLSVTPVPGMGIRHPSGIQIYLPAKHPYPLSKSEGKAEWRTSHLKKKNQYLLFVEGTNILTLTSKGTVTASLTWQN